MTYIEAVNWLYAAVPNFQRDGGGKNYKIGLEGPEALWNYLDRPSDAIPTIHIAGTNGKGSSAHLISAGLQSMGCQVGVFSSPHLFNFRERAKIGTKMVPESFVAQWVSQHRSEIEQKGNSFFELTLMLAMSWFEEQKVDWIVLETGMGGRLDATNICTPEICLITNIGLDHKEWLGNTRAEIAREKAGIMKLGIPVVIVEDDPETSPAFISAANSIGAPLFWAGLFNGITDLAGGYQSLNIQGAAAVLNLLHPEFQAVWSEGFKHVNELTGFFGRWSTIGHSPRVVCDTGHNYHAFVHLVVQAERESRGRIHWILGAAIDKDSKAILSLLPKTSSYYFTSCSSPRGKEGEELAKEANILGLTSSSFTDVNSALKAAKKEAAAEDLIFVGGSTFVIADLEL